MPSKRVRVGLVVAAAMAMTVASGTVSAREAAAIGEAMPDDGVQTSPQPTRVISPADLTRIASARGMTLQWISWDTRGDVQVQVDNGGVWRLAASQSGPGGASAGVHGVITEVGPNYFTLSGTITIRNTPDPGRSCEATGNWRFEITQNRKYYRLRRFEWCDRLTDYVDIYF